jgi:response regulator of citrate/malate metabolism
MSQLTEITYQELLDAIKAATMADGAKDGFTTNELAEASERSPLTTRRYIKRMLNDGLIERCFVRREAIDGRLFRVPGYRKVTKGKAK